MWQRFSPYRRALKPACESVTRGSKRVCNSPAELRYNSCLSGDQQGRISTGGIVMCQSRLLWGWFCVFSLVLPLSAFADKTKEKAPSPKDDSRAAELVRTGLQAELAGNNESRQQQLLAAMGLEPEYSPAHWHLGSLKFGDKWLSLDEAVAANSKSPQHSAYVSKRDQLRGSCSRSLVRERGND